MTTHIDCATMVGAITEGLMRVQETMDGVDHINMVFSTELQIAGYSNSVWRISVYEFHEDAVSGEFRIQRDMEPESDPDRPWVLILD